MTRENTCDVVHGDREHWTQKQADHGDGNHGCGKGGDKPNYELEAILQSEFTKKKILLIMATYKSARRV